MTHGSLFSGIGGFDLAAQWAGWKNIFSCEINDFGNKILKHYWPDATHYTDIKTTDFAIHREAIGVLSGGFPCQPFSCSGKRKGTDDERHLWPEMLRAIREIRPRWVVGENVYGLVNWSGGLVFEQVHADLENEGYEVQAYILPAAGVKAPHRRDRVWFVAKDANVYGRTCYEREEGPCDVEQRNISAGNNERLRTHVGEDRDVANANSGCLKWRGTPDGSIMAEQHTCTLHARGNGIPDWQNFPTFSPLRSRDDGFPEGLSGITFSKWSKESLKALGNAVVPPLVYQIFETINEYEAQCRRIK